MADGELFYSVRLPSMDNVMFVLVRERSQLSFALNRMIGERKVAEARIEDLVRAESEAAQSIAAFSAVIRERGFD